MTIIFQTAQNGVLFICHPGAPCWSLFLSTFSHFSAFHLLANMYVLWSFSDPICNLLGKEQFLATYLTAGKSYHSYIFSE